MATEPNLPESVITSEQNRQYINLNGADEDRVQPPNPGNNSSNKSTTIDDRLRNPLGKYSSYTYQLSLYMISPGAYNAFVESGRTNINAIGPVQTLNSRNTQQNNGVYIVAQSGGVNKIENRSPYLDLDYFIDDLRIRSMLTGPATKSATGVTEINFKIIEPYGFSLITQLKLASDTIKKTKSGIAGYSSLNNAIKQFFVLGIRFMGYDSEGNIIKPSSAINSTDVPSSELYEQFYDIQLTKMNFKLDGRSTVYNISANVISSNVGFSIKHGRIDNNVEISASNVDQALSSLMKNLTSTAKNANIDNTYSVAFIGNGDEIETLQKAEFYSEADMSKIKSAMSISENIGQVNEATSLTNVPNLVTRQFKLKNDTSILQAIEDIISQSNYLTNALSVIRKANLQANQNIGNENEVTQLQNTELSWYHISAEVKVKEFDEARTDYSYDIKYIITPYKTPVIRAAFIPKTTKYYGPRKRYDYYFTGQNSEIINYEQTFNNTYFTVQDKKDPEASNQNTATQDGQSTVAFNKRQNESRPGDPNVNRETANATRTSLYDPAAIATAKISILGDPDFLIQETPNSVSKVYNQFYGPGSTINASGGQVFVEISFNEARDYDNATGLLEVNDKILLWDYPKDVADKIKGVVYLVTQVTSNFSRGKFTQDLDCNIATLPMRRESLETADNQNSAEVARLSRSSTTASSRVVVSPITPATPAVTQTTTASTNQRTVPAKSNTQLTGDAIRASRPVPTTSTNPNPVRDDDSDNNPFGNYWTGA
jgi:hypothetical protein